MGRAFEFRRARKERRWGKMAKAFTKLSKEITMAVKKGGPEPAGNVRLRIAIDNARSINMPKDKIEGAIKRATAKDASSFEEVVYEGYGPHGVAIVVECATDNPTRTVGNIRSYFSHAGGSLGTTGSLDFLFERKGVFHFPSVELRLDDLELELIDYGLEDLLVEDNEVFLYTSITDFSGMQHALERRGIQNITAEIQRIPTTTVELPQEKAEELLALIDRLEEDEDVQGVYCTLK
jgi:YebC/PmpR family DNA-binding regulatory protein